METCVPFYLASPSPLPFFPLPPTRYSLPAPDRLAPWVLVENGRRRRPYTYKHTKPTKPKRTGKPYCVCLLACLAFTLSYFFFTLIFLGTTLIFLGTIPSRAVCLCLFRSSVVGRTEIVCFCFLMLMLSFYTLVRLLISFLVLVASKPLCSPFLYAHFFIFPFHYLPPQFDCSYLPTSGFLVDV